MIQVALNIFNSAVSNVKPRVLIKNFVNVNLNNDCRPIVNKTIYGSNSKFYLVGFGKAVLDMALEVEKTLGSRLVSGVVSIPFGTSTTNIKTKLNVFKGAVNNMPDQQSVEATNEIINLVKKISKNDVLIILISGGGSSLFCKPHDGLLLEEKLKVINLLVRAGADITDLNTIRSKLSEVKGGRLLNFIPIYTPTHVFILSDVIGDKLDVIASGPTFTTNDVTDPFYILRKYGIKNQVSLKIKTILQTSQSEIKKLNYLEHVIIGNNKLALSGAKSQAEKLNYNAFILSHDVTGTVQSVAKQYCQLTKIILTKGESKNQCFLFGGETTVEIKGTGRGGRNQELALRFSVNLFDLKQHCPELFKKFNVTFLSAGTDGIDGPTDVAGAIGSIETIEDAKRLGLDVNHYLDNNDSYSCLSRIYNGKYFVRIGHTGTNVMDVHILLVTVRKRTNNKL